MFKRTKSTETASAATVVEKPGGKGRPTPTRKEAEAAAKARAKAAASGKKTRGRRTSAGGPSSKEIREGIKRGEEKFLPPSDRGPVRRFVRDYVDSRFSILGLSIPLMIFTLVLSSIGSAQSTATNISALSLAASYLFSATALAILFGGFALRFRVRRELTRRFPEERLRGTTFYAVRRAMLPRLMRLPKPQYALGDTLPERYS
ncbi:DUF3043 domain-containing protein [Nocardioides sp.]|uniref:DUF3043 domain-containing protein n=1 Tax=Nocardioides sp. TaxID=35761 RepID=UPI003511C9A6